MVRRQTYTLKMLLDEIVDETIRSDQDVQRLSGQWNNNMINELVSTVLTDGYIPPIILGEEMIEDVVRQWIIDGLQRGSSLLKFRYGNYKISSALEEYRIKYQKKITDNEGKVQRDEEGNIKWETVECDIRNKRYFDLPIELQNTFDKYQIDVVIHQDCTMKMLSKLVRRYNNHTLMNSSQKSFTYVDNYARSIREITMNNRFFKDCGKYTEKERANGVLERIVLESVMCMFHLDKWQKQSKKISTYLNDYSSNEEFERLNYNLTRLMPIVADDLSSIFTSKDSFIFFTLFDRFTRLSLEDVRFAEFLRAFKDCLYKKKVKGESFYEIEKNHSTKDKSVVKKKLDLLETLMNEYFDVKKEEPKEGDVFAFIRENVSWDITREDMEQYEEVLDALTLNVDNSSKLMEAGNRPSFLALVAYSFEKDMDLDAWIVDFFRRNHTYMKNQKENYIRMRADLDNFVLCA